MKKGTLSILLVLVLLLTLLPMGAAAAGVVVSRQNLRVDGKVILCQKYNIDDRNYFMLRDLALLLNGTGSRFDVDFDARKREAYITTGEAYAHESGNELETGEDKSATAVPTPWKVFIDGALCESLTGYNIGGSNFFQLRELGPLLGFYVDYDETTDTAIVISRVPGTPTPWLVREETDLREGELGEVNTRSTYDAEGRLLTRTEADGDTVWTETWTYDDLGHPLEQVRSSKRPGSGELLYREVRTWEYDLWGNLARETEDDGAGQTEWRYTYDDRGNLLEKGQGDQGYAYAYDERGYLTRETRTGVDGVRFVTEYTRDEEGHILLERTLRDGTETGATARTWEGDLCLREVFANAGGEWVREYTYNAAGNLVLQETRYPERTERELWVYDDAGRLLRREYHGGEYDWGEAFDVYTWEYDDAGHLLLETYANNRDDTWSVEYAYNEAGDPVRLYRVEWGKYVTETLITYDPAAGRMTSVAAHSRLPAAE